LLAVSCCSLSAACDPTGPGEAATSVDLLRGHALRPFAGGPDDAVGFEQFSCNGAWLEQSRLRREGRYFARDAEVCVEPLGEEVFCRTFVRAQENDRLVDVTHDGRPSGGTYILTPSTDAPCL
jgi:hypothetical protein